MRASRRIFAILAGSAVIAVAAIAGLRSQTPTPEARAVAYLSAEVPRWRREHPCYSCHNNGDATRALIAARQRGHELNGAIDDTLTWIAQPGRWDENATAGGFADQALAHVQFAGALTAAVDAGLASGAVLVTAGDVVARDQKPDGSWRLDSSQSVGSPATYGTALATWSARRTLMAAGDGRFATAIGRADRWLREFDPQNVLDSAAVVLALADSTDQTGRARRLRALDLIGRAQAPDGGWGLYATSASEPFDTAVVLLALTSLDDDAKSGAGNADRIARGREYLIKRQLSDGSWPETTRPPGQDSYAQRISTAGWATLALIATLPDRPETVR